MRVRLPGHSCKRAPRGARLAPLVLLGTLAAVAFAGCQGRGVHPGTRSTPLAGGPRVVPQRLHRAVLGDPAGLAPLYRPLSARLGVLTVRDDADWRILAAAIPTLGPCPDLAGGAVIGLATEAGTPVDGAWPLQVTGAHLVGRAAVLEAGLQGGAYLPNGIICIETVYVPGARQIVAIDLDGWRQYLD